MVSVAIKIYGELPLVSSGALAPYPMISDGKKINSSLLIVTDNEINLALGSYAIACI
jgi:hypothetical protein